MNRRLYKYLLIPTIALIFSACGGGGGGSSTDPDNPDNPDTPTLTQIVNCSSSTNIADYTSLSSEDTIVKDTADTVVTIYHDSEGNKLVCVEAGSASVQPAL
jgi:hypothetical protein